MRRVLAFESTAVGDRHGFEFVLSVRHCTSVSWTFDFIGVCWWLQGKKFDTAFYFRLHQGIDGPASAKRLTVLQRVTSGLKGRIQYAARN